MHCSAAGSGGCLQVVLIDSRLPSLRRSDRNLVPRAIPCPHLPPFPRWSSIRILSHASTERSQILRPSIRLSAFENSFVRSGVSMLVACRGHPQPSSRSSKRRARATVEHIRRTCCAPLDTPKNGPSKEALWVRAPDSGTSGVLAQSWWSIDSSEGRWRASHLCRIRSYYRAVAMRFAASDSSATP